MFLQSSGGVSAKAGGVHIVVTIIYYPDQFQTVSARPGAH